MTKIYGLFQQQVTNPIRLATGLLYVALGTTTDNGKSYGQKRTLNLSGIETSDLNELVELLVGVGTFDPKTAKPIKTSQKNRLRII